MQRLEGKEDESKRRHYLICFDCVWESVGWQCKVEEIYLTLIAEPHGVIPARCCFEFTLSVLSPDGKRLDLDKALD